MCGGTYPFVEQVQDFRGLSPRVRGNRIIAVGRRSPVRSIPACAGEPLQCATPCVLRTVYPRVCGGTRFVKCARGRPRGLSPRVRGNRRSPGPSASRSRSIPACAGEPSSPSTRPKPPGVYPRVCGGTSDAGRVAGDGHGLSPRVRGNRKPAPRLPELLGSIPACAGEPRHLDGAGAGREVYPRVCGGTKWLIS